MALSRNIGARTAAHLRLTGMEKLNARLAGQSSPLYNVDGEGLRMKTRPNPTLGGSASLTVKQSGTSNAQTRLNTSRLLTHQKKSPIIHKDLSHEHGNNDDSDSPDEIDMLPRSQSSTTSETIVDDGYVDEEGNRHDWDPKFRPNNVLKVLKFKKNREATPSSIQPQSGIASVAETNGTNVEKIAGAPSQRPRPPPVNRNDSSMRLSRSTLAPSRATKSPTAVIKSSQDVELVELPEKMQLPTTPGLQPRPFPLFGDDASSNGRSNDTPVSTSSSDNSRHNQSESKLSLTPLDESSSRESKSLKDSKQGKATKPAKSPMPSPFAPSANSELSLKQRSQLALSGDVFTSSTDYVRGKSSKLASTTKPQPFPMDVDDNKKSHPRPQPFPLGAELMDSIGSSSPALKRMPNLNDEESPGKRRKMGKEQAPYPDDEDEGEWNIEEDSLFIPLNADPRTLCPFCDAALPESPSPLLLKMLTETSRKSYPDPRPGNRLGRKAPSALFMSVCQRHQFESQVLPEAGAKGWPKSIDWERLKHRVQEMEGALRTIFREPNGARAQCIFWTELMDDVKNKGARATAAVQNQFSTFKRAQPGYYGELGSVIILQTLCDMFPPTSLDPSMTAPLSANEFMQRVLVPEVGVRLIMQDKRLKGKRGADKALEILRESSTYGVTMFPEGGAEWDDTGVSQKGVDMDKLGVADRIVMERARKRRKELEKEEDSNGHSPELISDSEDSTSRVARNGPTKGYRHGEESLLRPSSSPSRSGRPKPRPVGKAASKGNVLMHHSTSPLHSEPQVALRSNHSGSRSAVRAVSITSSSSEDVAASSLEKTSSGSMALSRGHQPQKFEALKTKKARMKACVIESDAEVGLPSDTNESIISVNSNTSTRTPVKTRSRTKTSQKRTVYDYEYADDLPSRITTKSNDFDTILDEPTPRPRKPKPDIAMSTSDCPLLMARERATNKSKGGKNTWLHHMRDTTDVMTLSSDSDIEKNSVEADATQSLGRAQTSKRAITSRNRETENWKWLLSDSSSIESMNKGYNR